MPYFIFIIISLMSIFSHSHADEFIPYQCEGNASFVYDQGKGTMTTLNYFGTSITIDIYHDDKQQALSALCHGLHVVQQYHYLGSNFSTYPYFTNIKTINNAPDKLHQIDPRLTELLHASIEWHQLTNGRFNIAIAPVLAVWRQARNVCLKENDCQLPMRQTLEDAAKHIDISKIILDATHNTVQMQAGMQLDLGGIAKGWMVEKVYDRLRADGITSFIINAGGNIRHFGIHPSGRQFITAIEDPLARKYNNRNGINNSVYHEYITAQDITLVSSGNYLNYFTVDGKDYHHIIDPTTLYPKRDGISVSVIMQRNTLLADVISTSLFLMPVVEAQVWLQDIGLDKDVEAIWYLDDYGNKFETAGVAKLRAQYQ
ncbi:FAD:protein FMN transferase [Shewanella sp. SNU WT4]|uniref:FAD:protein FMN transferase n=1 Tax=Shewanella sp. SNU WT4 TaxID=2590015 RepID=UPI00112849A1|nr:FAD:protein FMN transferase [Shewanella sp. SNU WT4]QDF67261.1 FAD:protein FMN transferase [Shewanella sp. SNU WT4]